MTAISRGRLIRYLGTRIWPPIEYKPLSEINRRPSCPPPARQISGRGAGGLRWPVTDPAQDQTLCGRESLRLLRALICGFYNPCTGVNTINIRRGYKVMIYFC